MQDLSDSAASGEVRLGVFASEVSGRTSIRHDPTVSGTCRDRLQRRVPDHKFLHSDEQVLQSSRRRRCRILGRAWLLPFGLGFGPKFLDSASQAIRMRSGKFTSIGSKTLRGGTQ
jgi:hypothetical protein